jgi:hypothetical protein
MVAVTQTVDREASGVLPNQLLSQLASFPSIVAEIFGKRGLATICSKYSAILRSCGHRAEPKGLDRIPRCPTD